MERLGGKGRAVSEKMGLEPDARPNGLTVIIATWRCHSIVTVTRMLSLTFDVRVEDSGIHTVGSSLCNDQPLHSYVRRFIPHSPWYKLG